MISVNDAIDSAAALGNESSVQVAGRLLIGHEARALVHFPKTAWRQTGPTPWRSAIWLNFDDNHLLLARATTLNGSTVVVEGQIVGLDPPTEAFGHLGCYGAEITVTDVRPIDLPGP